MDIKTNGIEYPAIGEENTLMIDVIKTHIKRGDVIILNTMREGELLDEAVNWLKARGIVPDVINDNYEPRQKAYNNNPRKVGGDVIYDDMNFGWHTEERVNSLYKFVKRAKEEIINEQQG